jgi:hypothetical protein
VTTEAIAAAAFILYAGGLALGGFVPERFGCPRKLD